MSDLRQNLEQRQISPTEGISSILESLGLAPIHNRTSLAQLLRRPEVFMDQLRTIVPDLPVVPRDIEAQVEVEIKYAGYVNRQLEIVERSKKMESLRLPDDLDYNNIKGLSREVREKLVRIRPQSLGQAARISGITPAAISLLSIYLKKSKSA